MNNNIQTAEQKARDLLERMGVEDAQLFTSGDLVELANIIALQADWVSVDLADLNRIRNGLVKGISDRKCGNSLGLAVPYTDCDTLINVLNKILPEPLKTED